MGVAIIVWVSVACMIRCLIVACEMVHDDRHRVDRPCCVQQPAPMRCACVCMGTCWQTAHQDGQQICLTCRGHWLQLSARGEGNLSMQTMMTCDCHGLVTAVAQPTHSHSHRPLAGRDMDIRPGSMLSASPTARSRTCHMWACCNAALGPPTHAWADACRCTR